MSSRSRPRVDPPAFLKANPQAAEQKTRRGLTQQFSDYGRSCVDVALSVLEEYYDAAEAPGRRRESGETDEYPLCSESVLKGSLSDHLTYECSG